MPLRGFFSFGCCDTVLLSSMDVLLTWQHFCHKWKYRSVHIHLIIGCSIFTLWRAYMRQFNILLRKVLSHLPLLDSKYQVSVDSLFTQKNSTCVASLPILCEISALSNVGSNLGGGFCLFLMAFCSLWEQLLCFWCNRAISANFRKGLDWQWPSCTSVCNGQGRFGFIFNWIMMLKNWW